MTAWRGWYHAMGHTYGTWLPGDARGWRSRHHREHVDGDYRNPPPPGTHDALHARSSGLKKREAVFLDVEARQAAGRATVEMLVHQGAEVVAFCLDAVHFHLLGRFGALSSRQAVGRAKKHAYFVLRGRGHEGKVWASRSQSVPIDNRSHQVRVYDYILSHGDSGAWVWTWNQGIWWDRTVELR